MLHKLRILEFFLGLPWNTFDLTYTIDDENLKKQYKNLLKFVSADEFK